MDIFIRSIETDDYKEFSSIIAEKEVYSNLLKLPYPSESVWKERLTKTNPNYFSLVAEIKENNQNVIVGQIGINTYNNARRKHVASIGMVVRKEYHRKGIGKKMLEAALDMTDNWLNIIRVELEVYTRNEGAIALYKKYGFKVEGRLEKYTFGNGKYDDAYMMARIKS